MELSLFDYIVSLYHCYCHCYSFVFVYYYITVFAMSMSIMKKYIYIYSKVIFFGTNRLNMLLLWLSVVYYDALYWNVHHTQTHTHRGSKLSIPVLGWQKWAQKSVVPEVLNVDPYPYTAMTRAMAQEIPQLHSCCGRCFTVVSQSSTTMRVIRSRQLTCC